MISACSACRLSAVSLSVSPFCKLEVAAEILTTSALSRNAANSKEVLVRVLGSTKKLTIVFPRRAGTFLISREPTVLKAAAVSRIVSISRRSSSRMPSKSLRFHVAGFGTFLEAEAGDVFTVSPSVRSRVQNRRFQGGPLRVPRGKSVNSCRCSRAELAVRDGPDPEERQMGCVQGVQTS